MKTNRVQFSFTLTRAELELWRAQAKRERRSLTNLIKVAVSGHLLAEAIGTGRPVPQRRVGK